MMYNKVEVINNLSSLKMHTCFPFPDFLCLKWMVVMVTFQCSI